jgi:hypothetical protein
MWYKKWKKVNNVLKFMFFLGEVKIREWERKVIFKQGLLQLMGSDYGTGQGKTRYMGGALTFKELNFSSYFIF